MNARIRHFQHVSPVRRIAIGLLFLGLSGCAPSPHVGPAAHGRAGSDATTSEGPKATASTPVDDELAQLSVTIDDLVRPTQGVAGVAYRIVETGEQYALRGDEAFPMASVYKFPMALAWLHQVDTGRASLDDAIVVTQADLSPYHSPLAEQFSGASAKHTVLDLITRTIETSDNTACDVLLSRMGGPAAVQENIGRLGVSGIRIDRSERDMAVDLLGAARPGAVKARDRASLMALDESLNEQERDAYFEAYQGDPRDRATPLAMLDLLTRFHLGETSSASSTELLRSMMTRARSRIGLHLPPLEVANKTGTGFGTFNDAGIVKLLDGRHLVLVVFVRGAQGVTWERSNELVGDIAKAAYETAL